MRDRIRFPARVHRSLNGARECTLQRRRRDWSYVFPTWVWRVLTLKVTGTPRRCSPSRRDEPARPVDRKVRHLAGGLGVKARDIRWHRVLRRSARATNTSRRKNPASRAAIVARWRFMRSVNLSEPSNSVSGSARVCMPSSSARASGEGRLA